MFKLCFSSIKGGVGKSSLSILTAKYIAEIKKEKVLVVDLDFQNSTSFHFVPAVDSRNIANAVFHSQIRENIIPVTANLHILQSSLKLLKMQTIGAASLRLLLDEVAGDYDWCILDTQPNYNAIVLNGLLAADLVITPVVMECTFDLKTALFLKMQLGIDGASILKRWQLIFTRTRKPKSEASVIHEYERAFRNQFANILETRIPDTRLIGQAIDADAAIRNNKTWEKLYNAIAALYVEIDRNYRQRSAYGQIG